MEFGRLQNGSCPLPFLPNGRDSVRDVLTFLRLSSTRVLPDICDGGLLGACGECSRYGHPIIYLITRDRLWHTD